MQFAKIINQEKPVYAEDFAKLIHQGYPQSARLKLVCPQCGKPVIFRHGKHMKPHFSHSAPAAERPVNFKTESDLHKNNKEIIRSKFDDSTISAETEIPLPTGERRADILLTEVKSSKQTALELQYSLISEKEKQQREADYKKNGIQVIWLLGSQSKNYQYSPAFLQRMLPFVRLHDLFGFYLPFWDENNQKVMLRQLDWYGEVKCEILLSIIDYYELYPQNPLTLDDALAIARPKSLHISKQTFDVERHIQSIIKKPNKKEYRLLDYLRKNMVGLTELPKQIFNHQQSCLFIEEPLWILMAYYVTIKYRFPDMSHQSIKHMLMSSIIPRQSTVIMNDLVFFWLEEAIAELKLKEWDLDCMAIHER